MDCSSVYIKMCEQAAEIQALRSEEYWSEGDSYYSPRTGSAVMFTTGLGDCARFYLKGEVWLPRQDQLQAMLEGTHTEKLGRLYRAGVAMILYPGDSMEQLWLALVMKELYHKNWNGTEWKDESNN